MKKKRVITLILIVLWMGLVFFLSQQSADESSELSQGLLKIILKIFKLDSKTEFITEHIIRKLAHFTLYTLGGMLIYLHINLYNTNTKNKVILSHGIGTIYAITDEIHQIFIPGRSGEIRDVLIDSIGVFIGLIFVCIIDMIKKKEGK